MSAVRRKGPVYDPGLCRCCGSIKKCRVLNLEYEFQGEKEVYSDMFMDCFGLMLSHLEGTVESERLVCATCVLRLRDACTFRKQVLMCEDRLLQASIYVHQPADIKPHLQLKTEVDVVKVEIEIAPEHVASHSHMDAGAHVDAIGGNISDTSIKQETDKPRKRKIKKESERDVRRRIRTLGDKLRVLEQDGQCTTVSDTEIKQETGKPRKRKIKKESERDVRRRIRTLGDKLRVLEQDGQCKTEPPEKEKPRPVMDRDDKQFYNCTTIVENSFVCPFETSFSDYHCVYCREIFTDPKELREHTSTHDPTKYKDLVRVTKRIPQLDVFRVDCRLCDDKIDDLDSFKTHITAKHGKFLFKKIQYEALLFKLTLSHLECIVCDATFGYFHALRNHMAEHYGNCICDICGAHFFEERRLTEHQKTHQKTPAVNYPCKECGKNFKSKHGRYLHIATTHKKEPTYQCGKCDGVFFSYALRCRHRIEVHGEKREFACEHCDRSYDNRKSWREHNRRAHLKVSKHKCDICDRMFYLPCQLKEHMTTHTGERNFRCEYCGKSYPRLRALRLHMKSHSQNKYRCQVCDATFTQNVSLRNHVKKQHQNVEESLRK